MNGECIDLGKDSKGNGIAATTDKLKASNFPASVLRIGTWEVMARALDLMLFITAIEV